MGDQRHLIPEQEVQSEDSLQHSLRETRRKANRQRNGRKLKTQIIQSLDSQTGPKSDHIWEAASLMCMFFYDILRIGKDVGF